MLLDIMIARVRFYRIQRIVDRSGGDLCCFIITLHYIPSRHTQICLRSLDDAALYIKIFHSPFL